MPGDARRPDLSREPYVNARTAAEYLSVSRKKLQSLARRGEVPAHAIGTGPRKMWRFLLSELDSWMQSGVTSAQPPRSSRGGNA